MKFTFLGHSAFKIESDEKTIFVDPWLNGPTSPIKVADVQSADIVLVTHDHGDHGYAEGVEICKKTGAFFVAINELALQAKSEGVEKVHTLNIGGSINIGEVTVTLTQAVHSCGKGAPTGFIIQFPHGTVYHAGDTGIFATMKTLGDLYDIDVALLPIGSYYIMDIKQATMATKLLGAKHVIPMHYNTFPVIKADPEEFKRSVKASSPDVVVEIMKPGESLEITD